MPAPIITQNSIRIFLLDKPELNPLLQGVKFTTEDIDEAIINVIDEFNIMSPPTSYSYKVENFPFRSLLLKGVSGHLLKGAAVNEAINQLDYAADGIQVNDKNKASIFTQLGTGFWDEFKATAKEVKMNQNINAIYGTIGSEYRHRPR